MSVTSEQAAAAEQNNDDRSIAGLIKHASEQVSILVREEIKLAGLEMSKKGKLAGRSVTLLVVAALLAVYAIGVLIAAAVLGVALVFDPWLAALIVGGGLLLIAVLFGLIGAKSLGSASPLPKQTIQSIKADVSALKGAPEGD
ncbi:MAG: phage holin family protein [Terriglobales bacterium]